MSNDDLTSTCRRLIGDIAPEADLATLDPAEPLTDQLDLDSMDLLNLYTAVHEETGVDIPEAEYPTVASLDGLVSYLAHHGAG